MRTSEAEALYRFYRSADRASRLMRFSADRLLADGLTFSQFELLDLLWEHDRETARGSDDLRHGDCLATGALSPGGFSSGGLPPMEAAERLGLARGSLTSLLNALVARNLAATRADPRDRRSKQVVITKKGRAAHRQAMIELSGFTSALLTAFSRDRFSQVQDVLDEFVRWLETEGRLQSRVIPSK